MGRAKVAFAGMKVAAELIARGKDPASVQEDLKFSLRRRSIGVRPIVAVSEVQLQQETLKRYLYELYGNYDDLGTLTYVTISRTCVMERTVITDTECVVVGGGTAGLVAAATAADTRDVILLNKGVGASYWSSGCIDVVGRVGGQYVECPVEGLQMLVEANPAHPYGVISKSDPHVAVSIVERALERFKSLTSHSYEGT